MAVWPPAGPPMAHGLPGSPCAAASELSRPLRLVTPTGWMGGRYTTSKPNSATRARARSASAKVPWRDASPLCERGNISYHAANRARSRSTHTRSSRSYDVRSSGARCWTMSASSSRSSPSRARAPRAGCLTEPCGPLRELAPRVAKTDAMRGRLHELSALEEVERHVLACVDLLCQLGAPASEPVGP